MQRSLTGVEGVAKADVSLQRSEAVVTFDDARTDVEALTNATGKAGYPSKPK